MNDSLMNDSLMNDSLMNDSCIHYVKDAHKRFILFYGNGFIIDELPKGTRVIYAPNPIRKIYDPYKAIENALENPLNSKPFSQLLKPKMRITIAFDDLSLPLPPMKKPDLRKIAIEIILKKLEKAGISDTHLIAAICLHRKMTKKEFEEMLGKNIVSKFYPDRLYNHDAEDKENIIALGKTEDGDVVNINKRAFESDLVIYVNINFVPMDGGYKSFATGLCDYETVKHTHNVKALMNSKSYFDPDKSMLHEILDRQGRLIESKLKTFRLEMTINNDIFPWYLKFLQKRHYELNIMDKIMGRALVWLTSLLTSRLQRNLAMGIRSNYGLIGAYAGDVSAVHKKALEDNFRQYEVDVGSAPNSGSQCDVLIGGIPDMSPYNVNSVLNPVLFVCLVHGYFFNLYKGKPLIKKGGVLILAHPLEEEFSKLNHPSYIDFYENVLAKTLDAVKIEKEHEQDFAKNEKYISLYRNSNAFHGVHPFYMWYWACYGLSYIGKTIIVKAKNKRVLEMLNFDSAQNIGEAVEKAKEFLKNNNPEVTYLKVPPIATVNV